MDELRSIAGKVKGRVQGVFYRASFRQEARSRGLTGWVRNLPDGRVEFRVQGGSEAIEALLEWARVGPPNARVVEVAYREVEPDSDLTSFDVRH